MKSTTLLLVALLAGAAHCQVVVDKIGGQCGGLGYPDSPAPQGLAMDNCWPNYECDHSENLACVRGDAYYWACESIGSLGPNGPVEGSQCMPPHVPGRKLIEVGDGPASPYVVPLYGACGGTGSQTPADKTPFPGCWENTHCMGENNICMQLDAAGVMFMCKPRGSLNYLGKPAYNDVCLD